MEVTEQTIQEMVDSMCDNFNLKRLTEEQHREVFKQLNARGKISLISLPKVLVDIIFGEDFE